MTSKRPYHIVTVVEELRHNGIYIQPCKEESDKYDKLKSQKLVYVNSHSIQDIVDQFSECPTEFENFCANLFQKWDMRQWLPHRQMMVDTIFG